jgi:peptide/nickel transport system substrate-binding protein
MVEEMGRMETSPHIETIFVAPHYMEAGSLLESRFHSKSAPTWEQNEWLLDPELDAMMEDAIATVDTAERARKYMEVQKHLAKITPCLVLFDAISKFAYQSYYVDWPQARGIGVTGVMGYDIDPHSTQVFPEKREELVGLVTPLDYLYAAALCPVVLAYAMCLRETRE